MRLREFHAGAGPTVVLLHSFNTAGWIWDRWIDEFDDYHLVIPDLPGYGENAERAWSSFSGAADEVEIALSATAPSGSAHVVGLSLGASVGIELALRHPGRVDSLLLASASLMPQRFRDELPSRIMLGFWNSPRFWRGMARSYGLKGREVERFVESGASIDRATAVGILREFRAGADERRLSEVGVPVLALAGDKDAASVRDGSLRRIARAIPGATTSVVRGGRHYWLLEQPERFAAELRAWLRSNGPLA